MRPRVLGNVGEAGYLQEMAGCIFRDGEWIIPCLILWNKNRLREPVLEKGSCTTGPIIINTLQADGCNTENNR